MKELIYLTALCSTILYCTSCSKKDSTSPPKVSLVNIAGQWQWVKTFGGWGAVIEPDQDSIVKIRFTKDSIYEVTLNDQVKSTGHFSIVVSSGSDSSLVFHFEKHFLVHNLRFNDNESLAFFKNDSCSFYDYQIADGASHLFKKVP